MAGVLVDTEDAVAAVTVGAMEAEVVTVVVVVVAAPLEVVGDDMVRKKTPLDK